MSPNLTCISCIRGFHWECLVNESTDEECCCGGKSDQIIFEEEGSEVQQRTRRNKQDEEVRDPHSTGRKRAAKLYPLDSSASCEWQGKSNKGGGKFPIQGCIDGLQQARHHGPDKNTLNNLEGNVHRICHGCHNRWHALNDPGYMMPAEPVEED